MSRYRKNSPREERGWRGPGRRPVSGPDGPVLGDHSLVDRRHAHLPVLFLVLRLRRPGSGGSSPPLGAVRHCCRPAQSLGQQVDVDVRHLSALAEVAAAATTATAALGTLAFAVIVAIRPSAWPSSPSFCCSARLPVGAFRLTTASLRLQRLTRSATWLPFDEQRHTLTVVLAQLGPRRRANFPARRTRWKSTPRSASPRGFPQAEDREALLDAEWSAQLLTIQNNVNRTSSTPPRTWSSRSRRCRRRTRPWLRHRDLDSLNASADLPLASVVRPLTLVVFFSFTRACLSSRSSHAEHVLAVRPPFGAMVSISRHLSGLLGH